MQALASSSDVIAYICDTGLYPRPAICGMLSGWYGTLTVDSRMFREKRSNISAQFY